MKNLKGDESFRNWVIKTERDIYLLQLEEVESWDSQTHGKVPEDFWERKMADFRAED